MQMVKVFVPLLSKWVECSGITFVLVLRNSMARNVLLLKDIMLKDWK